jgi:hypothetical protein
MTCLLIPNGTCRKGQQTFKSQQHSTHSPFFPSPTSPPLYTMTTITVPHTAMLHPTKRCRRTATTLLAGDFDVRPPRDVLTSLLNGVGPYKLVEKDEESRRSRRRERKERERGKKRARTALAPHSDSNPDATTPTASTSKLDTAPPQPSTSGASSFWRARPAIHIATMQRSVSVTPPPMPSSPQPIQSSPASTPGPSSSSSTSRTSSKRPRTPADDEDLHRRPTASSQHKRKKRVAVKKGWKGWVEGSPPPSEKLINLDAVPVLQERRTRSGKSFDAIGVGKDGWV